MQKTSTLWAISEKTVDMFNPAIHWILPVEMGLKTEKWHSEIRLTTPFAPNPTTNQDPQ